MGAQDDGSQVTTLQERPDLTERVFDTMGRTWPAFMANDPVGSVHWLDLYIRFPEYQVVVTDARCEEVLGIGNSLPLHFDGGLQSLPDEGWSWAIRKSIEDADAGTAPNFQCALAATVPARHQGKGLSPRVLRAMKAVGARHGLQGLLAPVRPSGKHRYPLIDFAAYCAWTGEKGEWFDPWLRTHQRLGARVVKPCMRSLAVGGSAQDWLDWAGVRFGPSGEYCVDGALAPVKYDAGRDWGLYVEPNLWMLHPFA